MQSYFGWREETEGKLKKKKKRRRNKGIFKGGTARLKTALYTTRIPRIVLDDARGVKGD